MVNSFALSAMMSLMGVNFLERNDVPKMAPTWVFNRVVPGTSSSLAFHA